MSKLLPVPFKPQIAEGYCLPACVEMVLAFCGVAITQVQLARLFETEPQAGTPFSRVERLRQRGTIVDFGKHASLDYICSIIADGWPCIVAVDLFFMPYAQLDSRHVVVVVGCDTDSVFVLDPAESTVMIAVAKDGFIAAWVEMESSYAVIKPT